MSQLLKQPVAVIGIGCRFPGGLRSLDALWRALSEGRDCLGTLPADRFDVARYSHPDAAAPGMTYAPRAGIACDVRSFDAPFWGFSEKEAESLDPQQRMALTMTWEAFEDAGIPPSKWAGSDTAVYIGSASADMGMLHADDLASTNPYTMTGTQLSIISNRISYAFDFHGASMTVDTACSSALVALDMACRAVADGKVPAAVAGGVNVLLAPMGFVGFSKAHMLSKTGACRVFDEKADGYVRSEGGAVVLLKTLAQAQKDGDAVHAVIRATAVNSDGRTAGIALPNGKAQAALMAGIYGPELPKARVAYVEAHGTGTKAGDPIEARAIGEVLGHRGGETPLLVGSVKSNLGHLETASGMAGLAKSLCVLEKGKVPGNIHLETPNPAIDFAGLGLRVPVTTETLPTVSGEPLVALNSFGFGGTNAHVVLERATVHAPAADVPTDRLLPLLLTAKSRESLAGLAKGLVERLKGADTAAFNRTAAALFHQREHLTHRFYLKARTTDEALSALSTLAGGAADFKNAAMGRNALPQKARSAWVYSGNGSQWVGMGRELLAADPVFAAAVQEADKYFEPVAGWSLAATLAADDAWNLTDTSVAQPLLFAVEVGMTASMRSSGLSADVYFGHSAGEVAAAWAAGALSMKDAVTVIYHRSRLQQTLAGTGAMAAVRLAETEFNALLASHPAVTAAAENAPGDYTVSGTPEAVDAFTAAVKTAGGKVVKLPLTIAFHSAATEVLKTAFLRSVADIRPLPADNFISSVTGQTEPTPDAAYWWRNLRETVAFEAAVTAAVDAGAARFIEVGPHTVLTGYVKAILKARHQDGTVTGLLKRGDGVSAWQNRLLQLVADGWPVAGLWPVVPRDRTLPHYVWNEKRCWPKASTESAALFAPQPVNPLLGWKTAQAEATWVNELDSVRLSWLAGHRVEDAVWYPAAGFIETAAAAARAVISADKAVEIRHFNIRKPLILTEGAFHRVRTRLSDAGELTIESRPAMTEAWLTHVVARTVPTDWTPSVRWFDEKTLGRETDINAFYAGLGALGLNYAGAFKSVARLWVKDEIVTARLALPTPLDQSAMLAAPPLTDGALQTVFAALAVKGTSDAAWLPVSAERLVLNRGGVAAWSVVKIRRGSVRSVTADVSLFDASGREILVMTGVRFQKTVKRTAAVPAAYYREVTRSERQPRTTEDVGKALFTALQNASEAFAGTVMLWTEAESLIRATLAAWAYEAVARWDEVVPSDLLFSTESFVVNGGWAAFLADCLADIGWAEKTDVGYVVHRQTVPAADRLMRTLLARYPGEWPVWQAVNAVGRAIPELLAGDRDPETLTSVSALCPSAHKESTALALIHWAAESARANPDEALRLGVVTTDAVWVKALRSACGENVHITVVASENRAMERLATALERTEGVAVVAAEKAGTFDGVMVPGGLVRTVSPASALASLAVLVKPAGLLLVADTAPNVLSNFIEGAAADWWVEADGRFYPPMPDAAGWQSALKQAGLEDARILTPEEVAPPLFVVARRPAFAEERPAVPAVTLEGVDGALKTALARHFAEARIAVTASAARFVTVVDARATDAVTTVLERAKSLAAAGNPRDWWVMLNGDDTPQASGVRAMLRVVKNEVPALTVHSVTLADTTAATVKRAAELIKTAKTDADEVMVTAGRLAQPTVERVPALMPQASQPAVLTFDVPGQLERLVWRRTVRKPLAADEIRVAVKATGLNFRDVMWAMGMLPEEALENGFSGPAMGMEAAGVVTEVGPDVTQFVPGDAVAAFAPACFATEIVTKEGAAVAKPENLSWAEAASVPVAFFTAWYALVWLARARRGERILIHGAAGGVGLAAIQIAAMLGLEVYATAGTDAKRDLVKSLGVTHVYDSRRLAFADEIRRDTAGKGVDIVLNSLAGAAADASLALLAPFGRFLELGKRDFYADNPMFLKPFAKNLAYFGIDVDQLLTADPALARTLLTDVMAAFSDGKLRALPLTVFPALCVKDAFRAMQASAHIGKIVVTADGLTPVTEGDTAASLPVDPEGLYLITGGLGGLGRAVAEKLVAAGARHLLLISRRGAVTDAAKAFVERLAGAGVTVTAPAVDIASDEAETIIQKILSLLPPVKGVVHAAGFIRDALLQDQTTEGLTALWQVKVGGAACLDRLSRKNAWPLDFFTVFSSATVLIGNPGQANYVAANAGLEAVVKNRRAAGLPANLIGWGPVADAGMLAESTAVKAQLERMLGAPSLTVKAVADAFMTVTASGVEALHYLAADWKRLRNLPAVAGARSETLTEGAGEAAAADAGLEERLKGKTDEEAVDLLTADVAREVAKIMGLAPDELNVNQPVSDIGMDSLTVVELAMKLEEKFGVRVAAGTAFAGATIRTIAEKFWASLKAETADTAAADDRALIETMSRQHGVVLTDNEKAALATAADTKEGR